MTGVSLGIRSGSYGTLQQNGKLQTQTSFISRKPSKMLLSGSREKDRVLPIICRYLGRKKVCMLILFAFAFLAFISSFLTVNKDTSESDNSNIAGDISNTGSYFNPVSLNSKDNSSNLSTVVKSTEHIVRHSPLHPRSSVRATTLKHDHPCEKFIFPPPPPADRRRYGPRPCSVCYVPVDQAVASMPRNLSVSPVLQRLDYVHEENPNKTETHGGSDFGGYPSLKQRNHSFDIKESMNVHCGFVKGIKPGQQSEFDIGEVDLADLEQYHDVIVASAIFGNYDVIQQPKNIGDFARENVPFYMFIDEETEASMRNSSTLTNSKKVGLWRIIVVHNVPYTDSRRNGKVPKLLLHRIFPNVRYSLWIDGKLQLVVDPYQLLERFLWRQNATLAISKHYRRFDVFEEAEANKAAGKYENSSIDYQIDFYKTEGLTPYSELKLPITSDVPEGCVIIKEHIPITNLFTCLWFNEVDRFTSRDQLSFSTVRDKIMSRVDWGINMFLDCERRNFVIQAYHRDLLEHMPPPPVPRLYPPPAPRHDIKVVKAQVKKSLPKRGKADKKSGSRRHRKVIAGNRESNSI